MSDAFDVLEQEPEQEPEEDQDALAWAVEKIVQYVVQPDKVAVERANPGVYTFWYGHYFCIIEFIGDEKKHAILTCRFKTRRTDWPVRREYIIRHGSRSIVPITYGVHCTYCGELLNTKLQHPGQKCFCDRRCQERYDKLMNAWEKEGEA